MFAASYNIAIQDSDVMMHHTAALSTRHQPFFSSLRGSIQIGTKALTLILR